MIRKTEYRRHLSENRHVYLAVGIFLIGTVIMSYDAFSINMETLLAVGSTLIGYVVSISMRLSKIEGKLGL